MAPVDEEEEEEDDSASVVSLALSDGDLDGPSIEEIDAAVRQVCRDTAHALIDNMLRTAHASQPTPPLPHPSPRLPFYTTCHVLRDSPVTNTCLPIAMLECVYTSHCGDRLQVRTQPFF